MIIGVSLYACTSILSAKLGVPHVTIGPGDASPSLHVLIHAAFSNTHCCLRLQYFKLHDTRARVMHSLPCQHGLLRSLSSPCSH